MFVQHGISSSYIYTIASSWNRLKHMGMKRPVLEQGTSDFPERSSIIRWLWEKAYSSWKNTSPFLKVSSKFLSTVQLSALAFTPKLFLGAVMGTLCSCFRSDVPVPCLSNHSSFTSVFIRGHHHNYSHSLLAICIISCTNYMSNNIGLCLLVLSKTSNCTEF